MIFNECGEIVTIENRYKSIDQWLNESYLIDNYLNEGKISAGIEKAIRWLIDGFMQLADWISGLRFTKSIKVIEKNKDMIATAISKKLSGNEHYIISESIDLFEKACKNPSSTDVDLVLSDNPITIARDMVNTVIKNKEYTNKIRRAISNLKVLAKRDDLNKEYVKALTKFGKSVISTIKDSTKYSIKMMLGIIKSSSEISDADKKDVESEMSGEVNDIKASDLKTSEDFNKAMSDKNNRLVFD